jgi:hypothetical protein
VVNSLQRAAAEAGVQVVTGDTKVVEKGKGDGLFINTTGIGLVPEGVELSAGHSARYLVSSFSAKTARHSGSSVPRPQLRINDIVYPQNR